MNNERYYLAGLLSRKGELAGHAEEIERLGGDVVARWLTREGDNVRLPGEPRLDYTSGPAQDMAHEDLADVGACDTFVLFTQERGVPQPGGGRFVEFGYAFALRKRLVIIGEVENLFLGLWNVERYPHWMAFAAHEWGTAVGASPVREGPEKRRGEGGVG